MKLLNIISNLVFFTGLILKFFHAHFNAILMLIGLAGVVVSLIIGLMKKKEKSSLLLILANFGWLILIFVTVKFLPIQMPVVVIASLQTLLTTIIIIRTEKTAIKLWPLIISSSIALFLFFMPTHERYKLLSINWNYEIETDYVTWDKYSWFLYQNGEYSKAVEASKKARRIANQLGDSDWEEFIDMHCKAIEERNWEEYR